MSFTLVAPAATILDGVSGEALSGEALRAAIAAAASKVESLPPGVVFARTGTDVESALRYLGCWQAKRPIVLLDPALDNNVLHEMVRLYAPAAVIGPADETPQVPAGYLKQDNAFVRGPGIEAPAVHPDLALLLTTSGSTGSPKLVRLTREAVLSNAGAIADALEIDQDEIAPTSLPLFYSYGLSILNSHLIAGATVLVVDGGVLSQDFWRAVDRFGATSLAGVPYNYEMLDRIRWDPAKHPSLKMLTQAGGRLRVELVEKFHHKIEKMGGTFCPMYGQTEAAPRIATLGPGGLPSKLGSAGKALRGGRLLVRTDDGTLTEEPGVTGEVIYQGPNVMMGYAESAADLCRGDELGGSLETGDLGYLDPDGYLFLTGRLKRIGKIFGVRVNLDDIEKLAGGGVAAVANGEKVTLWCDSGHDADSRAHLVKHLSERLKLHRTGFEAREIEALPQMSSGKIDYRALESML